jgi:hypothetical protein
VTGVEAFSLFRSALPDFEGCAISTSALNFSLSVEEEPVFLTGFLNVFFYLRL